MKGVITLTDRPGVRWGNQLFTYAFARGYAEHHNCELQTRPWIGQEVMQINDPPITAVGLPRRTEFTLEDGEVDIDLSSYAQSQQALQYYTRSQALQWFTFRPEVLAALKTIEYPKHCAHVRWGDYLLYPEFRSISRESYLQAFSKFGISNVTFIMQEHPLRCPALDGIPFTHLKPDGGPVKWLPDFYAMMQAEVLFRGNSSFSWWAAALADSQKVYAPVLDKLPRGNKVHCEFVEGNWPRIATFEHCSSLFLNP